MIPRKKRCHDPFTGSKENHLGSGKYVPFNQGGLYLQNSHMLSTSRTELLHWRNLAGTGKMLPLGCVENKKEYFVKELQNL